MIWGSWIQNVAGFLGVTALQAGFMVSMIFTVGFIFACLIATKGRKAEYSIPFVGVPSVVSFTYLGWLPTWTGVVLALFLSLTIAKKVAKAVT